MKSHMAFTPQLTSNFYRININLLFQKHSMFEDLCTSRTLTILPPNYGIRESS